MLVMYLGSLLSVDQLILQHWVCRCIFFHRSLLLKNPRETQNSKSWWSIFSVLLNEFSALSFWWHWREIHRFIGLFSMNLQETHPKVYQRKDMFSKADFGNFANPVDRRTLTNLTPVAEPIFGPLSEEIFLNLISKTTISPDFASYFK